MLLWRNDSDGKCVRIQKFCVSFEKKGLLIRCLIKCLNGIESLVLSVDGCFGYVVVA